MTNIIIALAFLVVPQVMASNGQPNATTGPATLIEVSTSTALSFIHNDSLYFGVSEKAMLDTIKCESSFNQEAMNPDDPSYGIAEFTPDTFYEFAPKAGITKPNIGSTEQQIYAMAWAFANNKAHRWTCWRTAHPDWNK